MWTEEAHDVSQFNRYLQWLHSSYRVHLRPRWTSSDILNEDLDEEADNSFDEATRLGTQMEHAPLTDRIVGSFCMPLLNVYLTLISMIYVIHAVLQAWELHRTINEAGMALGTPLGAPEAETILRNFVDVSN